MKPLHRAGKELQQVWQSISAGSRLVGGAVLLLGVAVICGIVLRSSNRTLVPLTHGTGLSDSQSASIRAGIREAGLPEPVERNGQWLVPASDRDRYRDVIEEVVNAPETWADSWDKANSALSRFAVSAERDDAREIARARLTSRLLNELPGIEQADVVWDQERQPGWNRPPVVRATVYLRPRPGNRISLETVHAVRLAVAGSKAYLVPENVTVMDLSTMVAFDSESLDSDFAARYAETTRLTSEYRQRAEAVISHIPQASVAVTIDRVVDDQSAGLRPPLQSEPLPSAADPPPHTFHQGAPNTGLQLPSAPQVPRSVTASEPSAEDNRLAPPAHYATISVSIPAAYYQQTALARKLLPANTQDAATRVLDAIEQEVVSDIRSRLAQIELSADAIHSQPTVIVQSSAIDQLPLESLVAPTPQPEQPTTSTLLAGVRSALTALTVLMACWLIWSAVRRLKTLFRYRLTSVGSRSAQASHPDGDSPPNIQQTPAPDGSDSSEFVSDIAANQVAEILNGDEDGIVMRRVVPRIEPDSDAHQRAPTGTRDRASFTRATSQSSNPLGQSDGGSWDIDELARLSDDRLTQLIRSVALDIWPAALSSAAPSTRRRVLSVLSKSDAEQLREALDQVRPIRLSDIDQAQLDVRTALSAG